jgi:hypothetical protein
MANKSFESVKNNNSNIWEKSQTNEKFVNEGFKSRLTQGMLPTITSGIVCFPACYPKI